MRIFLFVLLCFFATSAYSQSNVIMTKEKHDQLKRNIEDYKLLIKQHKALKAENIDLKNQIIELTAQLKKAQDDCPKLPPVKRNFFQRIGDKLKKMSSKPKKKKFEKDW